MKVKKLQSGNFRTQVVAGFDVNGKRIVKSFTVATEWEVLRMEENFKQNREETTGNNITVAKAMEMYIDSRENVILKCSRWILKKFLRNTVIKM